MSTNVVISNSISALKTIYFRKNHSPLISLVLVKLMQQIVRKYGSKLKFVNFCGHICFYLILKIAIKGITNSYKFQLQIWFIRGMSLNKFSHPLVHQRNVIKHVQSSKHQHSLSLFMFSDRHISSVCFQIKKQKHKTDHSITIIETIQQFLRKYTLHFPLRIFDNQIKYFDCSTNFEFLSITKILNLENRLMMKNIFLPSWFPISFRILKFEILKETANLA